MLGRLYENYWVIVKIQKKKKSELFLDFDKTQLGAWQTLKKFIRLL